MAIYGTFNGSDYIGLLSYGNDVTNNVFIVAMFGLIWFVMFSYIHSKTSETGKALTYSSLIMTIIGVIFGAVGLMDTGLVVIPAILTIVGMISSRKFSEST